MQLISEKGNSDRIDLRAVTGSDAKLGPTGHIRSP